MNRKREGNAIVFSGVVLCLGALNFWVFRDHYLGKEIFPWDFWKTYYSFVVFWTNLVRHGIIPQWVPFQGAGYPFFLNPQTGFFYPAFWLFVVPGVRYSLQAAINLQALHVLWGSCGAFLLLRVLTSDWRAALFGAVSFQFFGGFYSNSEHADIVRAFSWLPWLFWGATIRDRLRVRNYLLPLLVYCALTGSYPGNIGSHVVFLGLYLFLDTITRWRSSSQPWLPIAGLVLLGLGILFSAPLIVPNMLLRGYSHHSTVVLPSCGWSFHNWPSLVTPWITDRHMIPGFTGDPSMVSAFVGIPVLTLLVLMSKRLARAYASWWVLLVVALLLSLGNISWFYKVFVRLLPPLGLSRFPSSDYRGVVALSLVVLAAASLRELLDSASDSSPALIGRRLCFALLFPVSLVAGIFEIILPATEVVWICLLWAGFSLGVYLWAVRTSSSPACLLLLSLAITVVNAFHVLTVSNWMWTGTKSEIEAQYVAQLGFPTSSPQLEAINLNVGVPTRPARLSLPRERFSWTGYLNGRYDTGDYGNSELEAQYQIVNDPVLLKYCQQPLSPIIFAEETTVTRKMLTARLTGDAGQSHLPVGRVTPQEYQLAHVRYSVHLTKPASVVVNETWFPGWDGVIAPAQGPRRAISASSVEGILRAWNLPAGDYTLTTRFRTPYLVFAVVVALVAVVLYVAILLVAFAQFRRRNLSSESAFTSRGNSEEIVP